MALEKEVTLEEAKALYTIEIVKQIIFPEEENLNHFSVGIYGDNPYLLEAFQERKSTNVRGKRFTFKEIQSLNFAPDRYDIIYIAKKKRTDNSTLFSKTSKTLIINESKLPQNELMIRLFELGNKMKIELNLTNLTARGFEVSIKLLELAGTKEDLGAQLREKEKSLNILFAQVQERENKLAELNSLLTKNTQLLENAKRELEKNANTLKLNQVKLKDLSDKIASDQRKVERNQLEIEKQKQLILQKQNEINEQEYAVQSLQFRINENRKILKQQTFALEKKDNLIEKKEKTITKQRSWITIIVSVSVLFFILIYFLFRTNSLRKKANRELANLNAQLYELATTDAMTSLFNRRYFLELAQKELLRQQRHDFHSVVLMIDIDYFKKINDSYGHSVGDEVLTFLAGTLKNSMRNYDIVGRLGGEEFAMMLIECDIPEAIEIADRLCKSVANQTIYTSEHQISITISIGLSHLQKDDLQIEQVLKRADEALYQAKQQGRNRYCISNQG